MCACVLCLGVMFGYVCVVSDPNNCRYRIYSINLPGRLLNFLDLESGHLFEVGTYSRLGAY